MRKFAGIFLLVTAFLISCAILDSNSSQSKIVGKWQWIRSSGGIGGEVSTPNSRGVSNNYYNFDSNYTFSFFRVDTLVRTGRYSLKKKDEYTIIGYETKGENSLFDQRVQFEGHDTLILADECYDCYISTYVRVQ